MLDTKLEIVEGLEIVEFGGLLTIDLFGPDGELKDHEVVHNIITDMGDKYYAQRAAGIASPPAQVTGMHLGTGVTAAAKTGAGAAMVTYISGSNVAIDATYPQSSQPGAAGTGWQIRWRTTWAAGVATNAAITEAVIVIVSIGTNSAAVAADTIARAVFTAKNKGAADSLVITWDHLANAS